MAPADAYGDAPQNGRLVQRNGFLRLEEAAAVAEEDGLGYAGKWQLLRTQPVGRY